MKAGGLDVVSSYIVWEHIEEVQGTMNFSDNRNVTAFLAEAQAAGLAVALRIGPWVHGECRNGGVPDWATTVPGYRTNSSTWLAAVAPYYTALAQQLRGSAWQDGGPVVQVQLDNETPNTEYLEALRALAETAGINPGLYWQVTGWPAPNSEPPVGTYVPFYGGYTVRGTQRRRCGLPVILPACRHRQQNNKLPPHPPPPSLLRTRRTPFGIAPLCLCRRPTFSSRRPPQSHRTRT